MTREDTCECRCHDVAASGGRFHAPRPLLDVADAPTPIADVICREMLLACPRCQPLHYATAGVGVLFSRPTTTKRPSLPQYPRGVVPPTTNEHPTNG